jgi:tyrosyl-tRNA synthetase
MTEDFFQKGTIEIIDEKSFKEKLKSRKLRIKYGVDPTRPDIHLGHTVQLRKLRQLQDEGHKIIFLIGDYTTKIGDPSGRNSTRPVLSDLEIKKNAKTYFQQVGKILNVKKTEVRYNSEWFSKMKFNDILQLTGKFTVAQILERDDFTKRLNAHNDIGLHELLYPLMQAYDSVILKADVEFGGNDQKFNMLAGRELQKKMGQIPQDVFITKLLVGLDGKIKMSKSSDNYVALTEDANSMFGKIMSIPDELMLEYFELLTDLSEREIIEIKNKLESKENPRDTKLILAEKIVSMYHSESEAKKAKEEFINVFAKKELPADIPEVKIAEGNYELPLLLINLSAVDSNSEARRLIDQGGVKIDEAKITEPKTVIGVRKGMVVQVGKRKFYRIK